MPEFIQYLETLSDPRQQAKVTYPLVNILFIAICAIFHSAETWEDIHLFGMCREEWLKKYIDLSSGIPKPCTFRRLFCILNSAHIGRLTRGIIEKFLTKNTEEHICLDGKTNKGNKSSAKGITPIQIVSAWSESQGLSLAEVTVDKKSNEITAIPMLLDLLDIKGSTISIDAMGAQKNVSEKIIEKEGHYVLALKGNQGNFHKEVKSYMESEGQKIGNLIRDYFDDSHGRTVRRRYFATAVPESLKNNGFSNLKTLLATETISQRSKDAPVTAEWRYYITDHNKDNEKLPDYIRGHWGVENKLHWVLDVHLNDDNDKKLDRNAADNLSRIKRLLVNLVRKNDQHSKLSVGRKLKKMLWDENYFLKILTG